MSNNVLLRANLLFIQNVWKSEWSYAHNIVLFLFWTLFNIFPGIRTRHLGQFEYETKSILYVYWGLVGYLLICIYRNDANIFMCIKTYFSLLVYIYIYIYKTSLKHITLQSILLSEYAYLERHLICKKQYQTFVNIILIIYLLVFLHIGG